MKLGQPSFLSNPEWRELLNTSTGGVVSAEGEAVKLRSDLCNFLLDVANLISEVASIFSTMRASTVNFVGTIEQVERAIVQILSLKKAIESWYAREIEPRLAFPPLRSRSSWVAKPDDNVAEPGDGRRVHFPNLLFAVVVCVSNSMVIKLETLLSTLTSLAPCEHGDAEPVISPMTLVQRQEMVHQSLHFVKETSSVAAKPLSFGLQQLWFNNLS